MLKERLGICQWFHYRDTAAAEAAVRHLAELGVQHLRTDISWADASRPDGWEWYRWLYRTLHAGGLTILPCVYLTPPSIAENGKTNGPPRRLEAYPEFVQTCIDELGAYTGDTWELWNEPNNTVKWAQELDPFDTGRVKQGTMLRLAAEVVHRSGRTPMLGGMSPIDHGWLRVMTRAGAMTHCGVVAVHAFPYMWNDQGWKSWAHLVEYFQKFFGRPVWITEVGRATSPPEGSMELQVQCLGELVSALERYPLLQRAYFYSLFDLPRGRKEIEVTTEGYEEPAEHSLGLITEHGERKPAYQRLKELLVAN